MKHLLFRKLVQWVGLLALAHLISSLFYGLILSSSVGQMVDNTPHQAIVAVILWYNVIFDAIFFAYAARGDMQYTEFRKAMREDIKAEQFSYMKYFNPKEYGIKMGIAMAFQIPFLIFFSIFGLPLQYTPLLAEFYIMDAGCYLLTGSTVFGWVLNTLLFSAIYGAIKMLLLALAKRRIKQDLI